MFLVDRKDTEINNLNGKLEDEQSLVAQLQKKIKELTVGSSSRLYSRLFSHGITVKFDEKGERVWHGREKERNMKEKEIVSERGGERGRVREKDGGRGREPGREINIYFAL